MALRGTLTHWKTRLLASSLGIDPSHAIGLLESLWHVTAEDAPAGNIGRLSNKAIAMQMFTSLNPDKLVKALLDSGHLEEHPVHRLIVHDWHLHADDATDLRLARGGQAYAGGSLPRMKRLSSAERDKLCARNAWDVPRRATNGHDKPLPDPDPDPDPEPEPELKDKCVVVPTSSADADQPPLLALEGKPKPAPTLESYVEYWNSTCGSLPKVARLNDERRKKLKARIAGGLTPKTFGNVVRRVLETPFLMGDNNSSWHATFDFIIASDTTIAKILEGSYGRAKKPAPQYRAMKDPVESLR